MRTATEIENLIITLTEDSGSQPIHDDHKDKVQDWIVDLRSILKGGRKNSIITKEVAVWMDNYSERSVLELYM